MFVFVECTNEQKIWVIIYTVETFFSRHSKFRAFFKTTLGLFNSTSDLNRCHFELWKIKNLILPVKNCTISSLEISYGKPLSRTTDSSPLSCGCPILLQTHSISPALDSKTSMYLLPIWWLFLLRALEKNELPQLNYHPG